MSIVDSHPKNRFSFLIPLLSLIFHPPIQDHRVPSLVHPGFTAKDVVCAARAPMGPNATTWKVTALVLPAGPEIDVTRSVPRVDGGRTANTNANA